jgi:hypothetical protein
VLGQTEDEYGQHHRVVRTEEAFEKNEEADGQEVRGFEHE